MWCHYWYHSNDFCRENPGSNAPRTGQCPFGDLRKVSEAYFGKPRQTGTSHMVFKTPWVGDPRINIQDQNGKAKAYQVRQVLLAIDKLEALRNER